MKGTSREKRAIRRLIVRYLGGYKAVSKEVRKGIDKKYNVHSVYFNMPDDETEFFHKAATDAKVSAICADGEIVRLGRKYIYKWDPKGFKWYKLPPQMSRRFV
jgi:hypothetical protein